MKKRGPYFEWLRDAAKKKPYTTHYSQQQRMARLLNKQVNRDSVEDSNQCSINDEETFANLDSSTAPTEFSSNNYSQDQDEFGEPAVMQFPTAIVNYSENCVDNLETTISFNSKQMEFNEHSNTECDQEEMIEFSFQNYSERVELQARILVENQFQQDNEDESDDEQQTEGTEYNSDEINQEEFHVLNNDGQLGCNNEEHEIERIYEGARLTVEESDLLIMAYSIRHHLTDVGLDDLLELINCYTPTPINASKYKFLKKFSTITTAVYYYFCPTCQVIIEFLNNNRFSSCTSCRKAYILSELKRNGYYFVYIPLKDQLKELLSGPLFYQLSRDPENDKLSNVVSGSVHRKLRANVVISNLDITLQFNADGVQTFKSSKVSMCPIFVGINELKHRTMKENLLLAGIWAGVGKPNLDLFLSPFIEELTDLHENGFQCLPPGFENPIIIKAHTILAPVDSVERCALQNIHQFNGEYGCSQCLNSGESIEVGKGSARIYRGEEGVLRTEKQHERDARKATLTNTVVNGVKGVSLFLLLPLFNIIKSFPPEYMHCVLLGVVKLFVSQWFNSKNHKSPWYIGLREDEVSRRLLKIAPPCEVTRVPQSISNLKKWKASEFKNFLLYYSLPTLKSILPGIYYKHWSLLVYAMHIFNSDSITNEDFQKAEKALRKFVTMTELLYPEEFMKSNIHLLLHIPSSIKLFGALWAWSAFYYESYNFILRNMLHNSQCILQQICNSYLRLQSIKKERTFEKENCDKRGKKLFLNMIGKYRSNTGLRSEDDQYLLTYGIGKSAQLDLVQRLSIQDLLGEEIDERVMLFERFMYKNTIYHANSYNRLMKRNNSIIKTRIGSYMNIIALVACTTIRSQKTKYIILGKSFNILNNMLLCKIDNFSSSQYSCACTETDNIEACNPQDVTNKCILLPDEDCDYIIPLVNKMETD